MRSVLPPLTLISACATFGALWLWATSAPMPLQLIASVFACISALCLLKLTRDHAIARKVNRV